MRLSGDLVAAPGQDDLTCLPVSHHFGVSYALMQELRYQFDYTIHELVDHYFDTPTFTLAQQNFWLRVRYSQLQGGKYDPKREATLVHVRRVSAGTLTIDEETDDENISNVLRKASLGLEAKLPSCSHFPPNIRSYFPELRVYALVASTRTIFAVSPQEQISVDYFTLPSSSNPGKNDYYMIGNCHHTNSVAWSSSKARQILQSKVTDHVRSKALEVLFRRQRAEYEKLVASKVLDSHYNLLPTEHEPFPDLCLPEEIDI